MNDRRAPDPVTEFRTARRVEFADSDMGGIVHFARYLVFMETAEHEFLRSLGADAFGTSEGRIVGWPRVEVSCQYLSPAHYGDILDIHLRIARKGTSSLVGTRPSSSPTSCGVGGVSRAAGSCSRCRR